MPRATPDDRRDPLIALRIPAALDQRLRAEAADTGSSLSEIVRNAIEQRLTRPAGLPTAAKRARDLRASMCEHRTRQGNYCRRCERVV